jgi:CHAD domain-containing protein
VPAASEERELKLIVPGDFEMPPLAGRASVAIVADAEAEDLSATYFDTEGLRLLGFGITLRYRSGEANGPAWTLKLPVDGDDLARTEIVYPGNGTQPPAEVRSLLFGVLAGEQVIPVAEIKTKRTRSRLLAEDGSELAELVDDRVSVLDGNLIRDSFREIEIEARTAGAKELNRIARIIERAGASPEQRSKASRALETLRESLPAEESPAIGPDDPAELAVRPALSHALHTLIQRDPAARLDEDPEGVHRMRVASRRLRSVFRTFAPLIDAERVRSVVDEVRWLAGVLGEARDIDVLEEHLHAEAGDEAALGPLFQAMEERRAASRAALSEALSSKRYMDLLKNLGTLIADPDLTTASPGLTGEVLPELVEGAWAKLRKDARRLDQESPETAFHEARKLAKRARYAADAVAPFTSPKDARRLADFAATMTKIQNVLGEHQDAAIARDTLLAVAAEHPESGAFNLHVGRLVERFENRRHDRRDRFLAMWKRLDKGKKARWSKV